MRHYLNVISIVLFAIVTSCSTLKVDQEYKHKTKYPKTLGTIGEQKDFILEKDYNQLTSPYFKREIPLSIKRVTFNTDTYNTFTEAKKTQNTGITINYIDSLKVKPKFFTIDIADRVSVLKQLKSNKNKPIYEFLLNTPDAQMITSLALVLNTKDTKQLQAAELVTLKQTNHMTYELTLYKDDKMSHNITFKDTVIFGYQASNFCWKQNSAYKLELINVVETNDKCPKDSYTSAKRAKKNINYFKM